MSNARQSHTSRQGKESPVLPVSDLYHNGGSVPAEVHRLLVEEKLTAQELALYLDIKGFTKAGSSCWVAKKTFAYHYKKSPRQIQRMIAKLTDLGLIEQSGTVEVRGYDTRALVSRNRTIPSTDINVRGDTGCPGGETSGVSQIDSSLRSESLSTETPLRGVQGGDVSLLPQEKISRKKDDWSLRCAIRLHQIVTSKLKRGVSLNRPMWSKQFDLLRASLNGDEHLVTEMLDWYEREWDWIIVKAYCAETFRKRFNKYLELKDNVAHETKVAPGQDRKEPQRKGSDRCSNNNQSIPDAVEYLTRNGIDVEDMTAQIRELGFPKAGSRGLAEAVASSCQMIVKTTRRLAAMSEDRDLDEYGILADVANKVLDRIGHDYQEATVRWFRSYLSRLKRWAEWNGSWKPFVFTWENKEFLQIVDKCCESTRQADEFLRVFLNYTSRRK